MLNRILILFAALFLFIVIAIVQSGQITNQAVTILSSRVWRGHEEVFLFTKQKYKIMASIGDFSCLMWQSLAVIYTEAGPNCV